MPIVNYITYCPLFLFSRHVFSALPERVQPVHDEVQPLRSATNAAGSDQTEPAVPAVPSTTPTTAATLTSTAAVGPSDTTIPTGLML